MNLESFNTGRINVNGRIELPKKARLKDINGVDKSFHEKMNSKNRLCPLAIVEKEDVGDVVYIFCIPREGYITRANVSKCYELWKNCPLLVDEVRNGRINQ